MVNTSNVHVNTFLLQVIFNNNNVATNCKGILSVGTDLVFNFNELNILDQTTVSFATRSSSDPTLTASFDKLKGTTDATFVVNSKMDVSLAVSSDEVKLQVPCQIEEGAIFRLPSKVIVEKSCTLNICGTIGGVDTLTVRNNGEVLAGYPANTNADTPGNFDVSTIQVDVNGQMNGQTCSGQSRSYIDITPTLFQRVSGFSLNSNYYHLSTNDEEDMSPVLAAYEYGTYCNLTIDRLYLGNNQACNLPYGDHQFTDITIGSGATLNIEGDPNGQNKTVVRANSMNVLFGGVVNSVGTGFRSGGNGSGASAGQGGSYGGLGGG